jgi:hypothetical protein
MSNRSEPGAGGFVTPAEAARRVGRSARTVERWVQEGLVDTIPHPTDRRRKLLSVASLDRMIGLSPETAAAARAAAEAVAAADQAAIAAVVRGLNRRLIGSGRTIGVAVPDLPDEHLLETELARDLTALVQNVRGEYSDPPGSIQARLHGVLEALYGDPVAGKVAVPDGFWSEGVVGRHLARAQLLMHPPGSLVTLTEVTTALGVPRRRAETILERLGAARAWDPDGRRWLYPRDAIEAARAWEAGTTGTEAAPSDETTGEATFETATGQSVSSPAPPEKRRDVKLVRAAYHARYFPPERQRRRAPAPRGTSADR